MQSEPEIKFVNRLTISWPLVGEPIKRPLNVDILVKTKLKETQLNQPNKALEGNAIQGGGERDLY